MDSMVVHKDWASVGETTSDTTDEEVGAPSVGEANTHVEVLDGELTNSEESKNESHLGTRSIVSPVEIRSEHGSGHLFHFALREPSSNSLDVFSCLFGEDGEFFLEDVLRHTETDQVVVGDVLSSLRVDGPSFEIIISVLFFLRSLPGVSVLAVTVIKWDF